MVDLHLDPLAVTIPNLQPALVSGGDLGPANPAPLVPDPDREGVRIWGRAILRVTLGGAGSTRSTTPSATTSPRSPSSAFSGHGRRARRMSARAG
jgi:hypothetical protein